MKATDINFPAYTQDVSPNTDPSPETPVAGAGVLLCDTEDRISMLPLDIIGVIGGFLNAAEKIALTSTGKCQGS